MVRYDEDLELARRMLAGDEAAFEAFGQRYFAAVYRFALSRLHGDREIALEIVQTTMAKTLAKIDTYRGDAALLTWLCACCRFEILMHHRNRSSAPEEVELTEDAGHRATSWGEVGGAEATLLTKEEVSLVHVVLDSLPAAYARALELMYLERLPVKEIAARIGLQPKATESLLTRARAAFRLEYGNLTASNANHQERP